MTTPKYFKYAFAVGGDKAAVPDTTQPDGTVSWQQGWGPDYGLDPSGGPPAQDIPRDQMNQIWNDICTAIKWMQENSFPAWISSADNGGTPFSYDLGVIVKYTDGIVYRSVVPTNTATPGTDPTKWAVFPSTAQGFNTADVMGSYDITLPSGWLWLDGKTIGDVSSGGTARANADTSALFTVLWNSVPNSALPLQDSTGSPVARGASAAADFAAHRRMPLPDWRGRVGAGKDDLGGTAANRLTAANSGIAGSTLGANGGVEVVALTTPQMPTHSHTGTTDPSGTHNHVLSSVAYASNGSGTGNAALHGSNNPPDALINVGSTDSAGSHTHTFTTANAGGGQAHQNTQPTITCMYRIKL